MREYLKMTQREYNDVLVAIETQEAMIGCEDGDILSKQTRDARKAIDRIYRRHINE